MINQETWVVVTHCARAVKNVCECVCVCVCVAKKVCLELLLDGKSDDLQTWWVDAYH